MSTTESPSHGENRFLSIEQIADRLSGNQKSTILDALHPGRKEPRIEARPLARRLLDLLRAGPLGSGRETIRKAQGLIRSYAEGSCSLMVGPWPGSLNERIDAFAGRIRDLADDMMLLAHEAGCAPLSLTCESLGRLELGAALLSNPGTLEGSYRRAEELLLRALRLTLPLRRARPAVEAEAASRDRQGAPNAEGLSSPGGESGRLIAVNIEDLEDPARRRGVVEAVKKNYSSMQRENGAGSVKIVDRYIWETRAHDKDGTSFKHWKAGNGKAPHCAHGRFAPVVRDMHHEAEQYFAQRQGPDDFLLRPIISPHFPHRHTPLGSPQASNHEGRDKHTRSTPSRRYP